MGESSNENPSTLRTILCFVLPLFIPIFVAVFAYHVGMARGPMWLGSNNDPAYAYLFNALNLATLNPPALVEHPGTPVQIWGALVITAINKLGEGNDVVKDVIARPEFFLQVISLTFLFCYVALLYTLGLLVMRFTGSILAALLSQATPLLFPLSLQEITKVSTEPFLLILSCLWGMAIIRFAYGSYKEDSKKLPIILGVLLGVSVATKMTAAPLVVIPLILARGSSRRYWLCATVFSFCAAVSPIFGDGVRGLRRSLGWTFNLITHSGYFGSGPSTVIDVDMYLPSLIRLVSDNLPSVFVMALSAMVLCLIRPSKENPETGKSNCKRAALTALVLAQLLQFLLVAKHPSSRYLLPSLSLVGINLVLTIDIMVSAASTKVKAFIPYCIGIITLGLVALEIPTLKAMPELNQNRRFSELSISQEAEKYRTLGRTIISYSQCSSLPYALSFGNDWSRMRYSEALCEMYPEFVNYDIWKRHYNSFSKIIDPAEIQSLFPHVIYHGTTGRLLSGPYKIDIELTPVCMGEVEALYAPVTLHSRSSNVPKTEIGPVITSGGASNQASQQ